MQGWIKLHRNIKNHWLYEEKRTFSNFEAWVDLLLEANHKDNKVLFGSQLIEIKRGQTITSIRKLCEKWGWSNTKVTKFLNTLKNDAMIIVKSDTKKTLITVVNYDFYQDSISEKTTQKTTENRRKNDTKTTQKHTNKNITTTTTTKSSKKTNAFVFYENNLGMLKDHIRDEIGSWLDDFNGQDEILIYAMQITLERNKNNWGFAATILKDWYNRGAKTLEDCQALQNEFYMSRKKVVNFTSRKSNKLNREEFNLNDE